MFKLLNVYKTPSFFFGRRHITFNLWGHVYGLYNCCLQKNFNKTSLISETLNTLEKKTTVIFKVTVSEVSSVPPVTDKVWNNYNRRLQV